MGLFMGASYQFSIVNTFTENPSLHLLDRLYVGGPHDVRGYNWNSVGGRADSSSCVGGATSAIGVLHIYRFLVTIWCLNTTVMKDFLYYFVNLYADHLMPKHSFAVSSSIYVFVFQALQYYVLIQNVKTSLRDN